MNLDRIWDRVDSCKSCRQKGNRLQHILGSGALNPKLMIVFINPTARNMSSQSVWKGPRFPFIGRKRPWDIFEKVGWIDTNLLAEINERENNWSYDFANKVNSALIKNRLYITNIIKCTSEDATLPKMSDIKSQMHLFEKEIIAVNPEMIVSFGSLPTNALLKEEIKVSELYEKTMEKGKPKFFKVKLDKVYNVFPCYYPIGRGNPTKAVEMLGYLNSYLLSKVSGV